MSWTFPFYEPGKPVPWADLELAFGWFRDMKGVPQDAEWHAEGDVFIHTKMVVEALIALPEFQVLTDSEKHILFAAAMFHDVEKRSTTTTELIGSKLRTVSPNHAKKGEYTARGELYRNLNAPFETREQIAKLVRMHGLPLWAIQRTDPAREVIGASLVLNTKLLAMLAKADILGRVCNDADELLLRIDLFEELCRENGCWGKPYPFSSDYARYWYLNKPGSPPEYEPFDDLENEVIMLSALPGSGKDRYLSRHLQLPVLSLDDIRREHKIDPTDKKGNGRVIQLGLEKARDYLRAKTPFVFNATNITRDMRQKWIALFTDYRARVTITYLEVPYKQLLTQNRNRSHPVPESVLEKLIAKLDIPGPKEAHEINYIIGED